MTADAKYHREYDYNAKNQLIKVKNTSNNYYYEFKYDYLGRRIEKYAVEGSTTKKTRFVYHGWNLIGEFNVTGTAENETLTQTKSYYWGLDKKSSLVATGGVEALLMIRDHNSSKNYYPIYDTRSNIVGIRHESGAVSEAYDYDPFGKMVFPPSPPTSGINPFGFQTKYTDRETGLVYYGHRYYDTENSRWLNRDPIQESGGLNLYAMVGNDPVNSADFLGLVDEEEEDTGPGTIGWEKCKDSNGNYVDCYTLSPFTIIDSPDRPTPLNSSLGFLIPGPVMISVYAPIYVTAGSSSILAKTSPQKSSGNKTTKTQKENDTDCLEFKYSVAFEDGVTNKRVALDHLQEFKKFVTDFASATGEQSIKIDIGYFDMNPYTLSSVSSASEWTGDALRDLRSQTTFGNSGLPSVLYTNSPLGGDRVGFNPGGTNLAAVSATSMGRVTTHEFGHILGWRSTDLTTTHIDDNGAYDFNHSSSNSNIMFPTDQSGLVDPLISLDRQFYDKLKANSKPCSK